MNLGDEEHVVLVERREQACQVAWLVKDRSAGDFEPHSHLIGNNARQSGLSQSRRTVEECVVESLASLACRCYKDLEIVDNALLPCKVAEAGRTQGFLKVAVALRAFLPYVKFVVHSL